MILVEGALTKNLFSKELEIKMDSINRRFFKHSDHLPIGGMARRIFQRPQCDLAVLRCDSTVRILLL